MENEDKILLDMLKTVFGTGKIKNCVVLISDNKKTHSKTIGSIPTLIGMLELEKKRIIIDTFTKKKASK